MFYTISNFVKFTIRLREYRLEVGYDELRWNVELIGGGGGGSCTTQNSVIKKLRYESPPIREQTDTRIA